jgi:hypothetical protein
MNAAPDKTIIEEVALELGINPAFVEKDGEYLMEYDRIVQGMSYASGKVPSYEEALVRLKKLTNHLLES